MYSRSVKVRADDRYANNIPPVYGGSRFYRAPPADGIAVQYEARRVPEPPSEAEEITAEAQGALLLCQTDDTDESDASCEPACADACPPPPQTKDRLGTFLHSFIDGDKEELLLIAVLLLLCGEEERAGDMIAILLLLIILR